MTLILSIRLDLQVRGFGAPTATAIQLACDNFLALLTLVKTTYPDQISKFVPRYLSSNPCETFFAIARAKLNGKS